MTERELSEGELNHFLDHVNALAENAGYELDDQERQQLFALSQEGGFSPAATAAAFAELYDVDESDDGGGDDDADLDWDDGEDANVEEPEPAEDTQFTADMAADIKRLSGQLGRPLSNSEVESYATSALGQLRRTGRYERDQAAEGFRSYSDMTSDERNDHMVARARELAGDSEVDMDREYDIENNRDDLNDYMVLKVQGHEFDDTPGETPESSGAHVPHVLSGGTAATEVPNYSDMNRPERDDAMTARAREIADEAA